MGLMLGRAWEARYALQATGSLHALRVLGPEFLRGVLLPTWTFPNATLCLPTNRQREDAGVYPSFGSQPRLFHRYCSYRVVLSGTIGTVGFASHPGGLCTGRGASLLHLSSLAEFLDLSHLGLDHSSGKQQVGLLVQGSLNDTFCNHLKHVAFSTPCFFVGNHHLQVAMFRWIHRIPVLTNQEVRFFKPPSLKATGKTPKSAPRTHQRTDASRF